MYILLEIPTVSGTQITFQMHFLSIIIIITIIINISDGLFFHSSTPNHLFQLSPLEGLVSLHKEPTSSPKLVGGIEILSYLHIFQPKDTSVHYKPDFAQERNITQWLIACLLSMHEGLGSIPTPENKIKRYFKS